MEESEGIRNTWEDVVVVSDVNEQDSSESEVGTRDLLVKILTKMGCKCHVEDDEVSFSWQGGNFYADVNNDRYDVDIWYHWAETNLDETNYVLRWIKIINDANHLYSVKAVYDIDEDAHLFHIYNKVSFMLHPEIRYKKRFLRTLLGRLFVLRRYIETEFEVEDALQKRLEKKAGDKPGSFGTLSDLPS